MNIKKQFTDLNQTYTQASKRQDQIYATDALLSNLMEASNFNQYIPDPQVQYE